MNIAIQSFIGTHWTVEGAIKEATAQANEWLKSHAWVNPDGYAAHVMQAALVEATDNGYTYVIHLIGTATERAR